MQIFQALTYFLKITTEDIFGDWLKQKMEFNKMKKDIYVSKLEKNLRRMCSEH
jgi:hypothetical protein